MWEIAISLFVVIIGIWLLRRKRKFSLFKNVGIPGPEPNIFTGNIMEFLKENPIECHKKWIEKYGKVMGYFFGGNPFLVVADIEILKQILIKDFHKFPNRPFIRNDERALNFFPNQLISLTDRRWKEIRSIITPTFTTSKMRMMTPIMTGGVDTLMKIIDQKSEDGDSFDILQLYRRVTLDIIGRTAFGIQTDVQTNHDDSLLKALEQFTGGEIKNAMNIIINCFPEVERIMLYIITLQLIIKGKGHDPVSGLIDTCKEIMELRRKNRKGCRPDLLQLMMDSSISEFKLKNVTNEDLTGGIDNDEDQTAETETKGSAKNARFMTDTEIIDNCVLFLLAGQDTTSSGLAFTTHFLLNYPEVQEKIRNEVLEVIEKEGQLNYNSVQQLKYLDQVIMESLRIYPPVGLFVNRQAEEDVQYGKYKIPKGMPIQIPVYYLNHDPELWPDPEKFDPSRFSPENKSNINVMGFQTFGVGPRNCVGMRFAIMEIKLTLANILHKFRLLPVEETDGEPLPLNFGPITINPANGIKLKAVPL